MGRTVRTRRLGRLAIGAVALVLFAVCASGAFADDQTPPGGSGSGTGAGLTPSISADQSDYPPGATVTLTGSGWGAGESVHIVANDTLGATWQHTDDVLAGLDGSFTTQFDLAAYFVSDYDVTATGSSGAIATTRFTDTVHVQTVALTSQKSDCSTASTSFAPGDTVCLKSVVGTNGNGAPDTFFVQWTTPSAAVAFTDSHTVTGNTTLTDSHGVSAPGTWTVKACSTSNCAGGTVFDTKTFTVTATKAPQTITFAALGNKTFGDPPFTVSATGGGSGNPVTFSVGATDNCTSGGPNGSTITLTGAGTCTVTANQAGNASFDPAPPVSRTFSIARAAQTIAFGSLPGETFGAAPFTVSATGGASGNPVTFGASGNCTSSGTNGSTITITGAGSCTVTANQAGSPNYNAAAAVPQTFSIAKAGQAIAFDALSDKTYGDAPFTVFATGGGSGNPVTFSVGAADNCTSGGTNGSTITITGAGSCTVTASQAGNGDYDPAVGVARTFLISKASLTVTADPKSKVYGSADPALTYQLTSGSLLSGDSLTGALTRAAGESVAGGPYPIAQGTLTAGGNYTLTFVGAALTITPKSVTVTADDQSKVYGNSDPSFTFQVAGLESGDHLSGVTCGVAGTHVNAGAYDITCAGNTNTDYDASYVGGTYTIKVRPVTVAADPQTRVYGDADPDLTYHLSAGTLAYSDAFSGSLVRAAGEDVGPYAITQGSLTAGTNYDLTFVGANLTVTTRPVTITAAAKSKVYGTADPALTYDVTSGSLAFSDVFTGALVRDPGEDVGDHAINQGSVSLGGNYDLTYVGANLTITTRPVTIAADAKTKVYGDDDPELTYQITSGTLAFSDAFSGVLARDAGQNVGDYPITQGTVSLGSNYDLTYVGANLAITKALLAIDADSHSKIYGDDDPVATYSLTGFKFIDGPTTSGITGEASCSYTGSAHDVAVYPNEISCGPGSLLAPNYDFAGGLRGELTISQRPITVTADPQTKVYGNADPALTYHLTSGALAYPEDAFSGVLARDSGQDVGGYPIRQGTVTAGSNYDLTYVGATLSITKAKLSIDGESKSKVYGDPDPPATYLLSGFKFSDTSSTSGITGAPSCVFADSNPNVGTYLGEISCEPGTLAAPNYDFAGGSKGTLTITQRPITVTADPQSKVYGDPDPALSFQITSGMLVTGDSISGSLTRAPGGTVAGSPYAILQGTLTAGGNYDLTYHGANLTITQKTVTASFTAANKVYDGNVSATVNGAVVGKLSGDDVSLTGGTQAFQNKDAAPGKTVDISGYVLSGTDRGNYSLVPGPWTAKADITAKAITVTADAKSKILGAADPVLTYTVTYGSLVGTDAFSGSLARDPGEAVGPYAIKLGTLTAGSNYALTFVSATFNIYYAYSGFLQPINDTAHQIGVLESRFKAGQTIPAKFLLKNAAGGIVQQATNPTFTRSNRLGSCDAATTLEATDNSTPDPNAIFTWDGSQYHYNWSTKGLAAGEYRIFANLADGTKPYVDICLS